LIDIKKWLLVNRSHFKSHFHDFLFCLNMFYNFPHNTETLQNDFTETLQYCLVIAKCCWIIAARFSIMLRCPLFVILQWNVPAILQCNVLQCNVFGKIFYENSKMKTIFCTYISLTSIFLQIVFLDKCFSKVIFYDKTIKYFKCSINSEG